MLKVYELFNFSSLIEWHSVRTPMLVVALVVVGSIGTVIKCMFINFIWRHAPANRPINSLLMKDQIILLATTLILALGNIISLSSGSSLYDIFGDKGCFVYWAAVVIFTVTLYTSSFAMTVFRWINIIHIDKAFILGVENVKTMVYILEGTISGLIYLASPFLYFYGSTPVAMSFCYNKSKTFLEIMASHSDPVKAGPLALNIYLTLLQTMGILELIMYAILFKTLWSHDQKMKGSLSKENLAKRNKNNVITLSGQTWAFFIEFVSMIIIRIAISLDMNSVFLQPQMGTFYIVMASTTISIGQFVTSPDMRRFYNFLKTD